MVSKLKRDYGGSFTIKLEGMFSDWNTSIDFAKQFAEHCENHPELLSVVGSSPHPNKTATKLEFIPQLLTQGNWPTYTMYDTTNLPPAVIRAMDAFTAFHTAKFNSRKLHWVHSLGQVELRAKFNKVYTMTVAPLQAVVLMLFNQDDGSNPRVPFSALQLASGIEEDPLKKILHSLMVKFKVISKHSAEEKPSAAIKATDSFSVNEKFT